MTVFGIILHTVKIIYLSSHTVRQIRLVLYTQRQKESTWYYSLQRPLQGSIRPLDIDPVYDIYDVLVQFEIARSGCIVPSTL